MRPSHETVVTLGEALVAMAPETPTGLHRAPALRMHPGGAEVNLAVGLARLGISAEWVGRLGDDPLGRLVLDALQAEGVTARATIHAERPTGLYLREWLPDGTRRPWYYRRGSAGSALCPSDWRPERWHLDGAPYAWLYVAGITCALGPGPRATAEPGAAIAAAHAAGVGTVVLKRGELGAIVSDGSRTVEVPAVRAAAAVDPVGAGDAFDAGCPRLDELPADLRALL
jgi:2-dehydro-3-deoxygluconokinase